jgi:ABC-type Na+ efflux pump permease subunit
MPVIEVDDLTFRYPKTAARGERTVFALLTTPLRFRHYLTAKLLTMSALALVTCVVVVLIGLAVFTVPVIPFFILDSPWQLAFGVIPAYWPVRAFWSAFDGGSYWPYVVVGLLYNAALVGALLRVVTRRLR